MKNLKNKGFTLIEYIVATTIFALMVVFAMNTYALLNRNLFYSVETRSIQVEVRNISDVLIREASAAAFAEIVPSPAGLQHFCDTSNPNPEARTINISEIRLFNKNSVDSLLPTVTTSIMLVNTTAGVRELRLIREGVTVGKVTDFNVDKFAACLNKTNPQTVDISLKISGTGAADGYKRLMEANEANIFFTITIGGYGRD